LGAVLKVDDTLSVLCIFLPFTNIHITIWILAETLPAETTINELTLVSYPSVLNEHA
jgi:hypothetical protein